MQPGKKARPYPDVGRIEPRFRVETTGKIKMLCTLASTLLYHRLSIVHAITK